MKSSETRPANRRKMLALLLIFTANLFFSQVGVMAQKKSAAPQEPTGDGLGTDDFWTVTGSTGTVDEDDLSIADVNFNFVGHKTGKTGTVNIRYNIVAIEGANQGDCCAGSRPALNLPNRLLGGSFNGAHQIRVRYRDSDGHAAPTQVKFSIKQVSIFNGGETTLYTFDSNTKGQDIGDTQLFTETDCEAGFDFDFDFSQYAYYIDAEVTRTSASAVARISLIQITETNSVCSSSV